MYSDRRKQGNQLANSDEIDMLDLLKKIWRARILIAKIVLISAIIALIALTISPSYYKIETTIDAVSAVQLRPLSPSILGSVEYQTPAPDEKKIYDRVLLQVNSLSALKAFWEKRTGKTLDLAPDAPSTDESRSFKKFYKALVLDPLNSKTPEITARKISLTYRDPKEGVKLLNDYLVFLNQQMWLEQSQKIQENYNANLKALAVSYDSRNLTEQQKLTDELTKIRENVKIAESLGIKETPFKALENIQLKILDSQDYLLGTKALMQQIDILVARQGKSLAPFTVDLRNMEMWRDQMNIDLQRIKELDGNINLFSIVNPPASSLDPVKPNKPLIFIAVVFLATFFGICLVLIRSAVKNHRAV
ncbi:MAG: Wzz/FepE/Etk N-terminal domain-containing protein [Pseudomonadota bacterium]